MPDLRIGVVGATGAVGTVTLELLAERGFADVRAFASSRSAGSSVRFGDGELVVEEATPETLAAGDLDLVFFSVGTEASRELRGRLRSADAGNDSAHAVRRDRIEPRHEVGREDVRAPARGHDDAAAKIVADALPPSLPRSVLGVCELRCVDEHEPRRKD